MTTAFRQRREELNLTHEQVADRSGFSVRTVYRLETEGRLPRSSGAIQSYAEALGLPVSDLRNMVARERQARSAATAKGKRMVGRRGHGQVSCPKPTHTPARRAGRGGK
jgi:transcriptional regulator with XRE-family HTH domain